MQLTKHNFRLYAAHYYDNPMCFNEDEFLEDLRRVSTVMRTISRINNGEVTCVHRLINNVLSFYNVFDHHAATNIMAFKLSDQQIPKLNSILQFLSLPVVPNHFKDETFFQQINQELSNV